MGSTLGIFVGLLVGSNVDVLLGNMVQFLVRILVRKVVGKEIGIVVSELIIAHILRPCSCHLQKQEMTGINNSTQNNGFVLSEIIFPFSSRKYFSA